MSKRQGGKKKSRQKQAEADLKENSSAQKKPGRGSKATWKLMNRSTGIASGLLAPLVATGVWRLLTGKKPPTSSDNPEIDAREAIMWALLGGALVEVVKVAVRRGTAQYWVKSTGELPPGMKHVAPKDDVVQT
ncbi:MAG: DUF4235 domain-containing protein [Aeromicrobium sp.]|uniref:DUF4235 domain-containing protein n=1 Tax=Aeromicrobium sp. TaxID=1871063 RepID=UPI0039E305F3